MAFKKKSKKSVPVIVPEPIVEPTKTFQCRHCKQIYESVRFGECPHCGVTNSFRIG